MGYHSLGLVILYGIVEGCHSHDYTIHIRLHFNELEEDSPAGLQEVSYHEWQGYLKKSCGQPLVAESVLQLITNRKLLSCNHKEL